MLAIEPASGAAPLSRNQIVMPSAKMSLRASSSSSINCSGLANWMVKNCWPVMVSAAVASLPPPCRCLTSPKSTSLSSGCVSSEPVSMTLAGLTSRWMNPCECAQPSASVNCRAQRSTLGRGSGPTRETMFSRLPPPQNSIA